MIGVCKMVDKEITSEMIIKTLEICANGDVHSCEGCPFYESSSQCISNLMKSALGLIKSKDSEIEKKDTEIEILIRKKHALRDEISELMAEVERLKEGINFERERVDNIPNLLLQAKSEAYRGFAEQLEHAEYGQIDSEYATIIYTQDDIDNALKELTEGESK